jgi:dihydroneopterin aldolase
MLAALSHPRLADCRRLFLRNYEVRINIGVHDFEKQGEQRVVINVELFVPLALSTPTEDKLREVVDYDFMRSTIAKRVGAGISTCRKPSAMTSAALLEHPNVRAVVVSTEKPDVYPTAMPWASKSFASKR